MSLAPSARIRSMKELLIKYEINEELGTGAFSEVRKATEKATGKKFAVKIIDRTKCKGKEGMIQSEIDILTKVQHRNIISLFEMFESETKIFLVMQLVTGGELFDRIVERGHYTEADASRIVYPILLAVDYLHEMGIAHRDLKPENLLFSDKSPNSFVMISDFGLSKIFDDDEMMKTACGTPGYVAPEVLRRQGYGKEVDVWSIGVITYILLCGYPPFYDEHDVELFGQIMRGEYEFDSPYWDNVSREAKDFIKKMLVVNPNHRINVKGALKHPFITENNVIDEAYIASLRTPLAPATSLESSEIIARKQLLTKTDSEKSNLAPTVQSNMQKFSPKKFMSAVTGASKREKKEKAAKSAAKAAPGPAIRVVGAGAAARPTVSTAKAPASPAKSQPTQSPVSPTSAAAFPNTTSTATVTAASVQTKKQSGYGSQKLASSETVNKEIRPRLIVSDDDVSRADDTSSVLRPKIDQHGRPIADSGHVRSEESVKSGTPGSATASGDSIDSAALSDATKSMALSVGSTLAMPSSRRSSVTIDFLHSTAPTITAERPARILSYSIFLRPPGIKNNASDHKDSRLNEFCSKVLDNYDVICLQEAYAYGSSRRNNLIVEARKKGLEYYLASATKGLLHGSIDGGLLILSRFPIVRSERMTFKKGLYGDRFAAKGALYAKIELTASDHLHLFNAHTQGSPNVHASLDDPSVSVRIAQFAALRTFIDTCLADHHRLPQEPIYVTGTLNTNARPSDAERLRSQASSTEYSLMMSVLRGDGIDPAILGEVGSSGNGGSSPMYSSARQISFIDLAWEKYKNHPVTYGDTLGDGDPRPRETTLTAREFQGVRASLDYALFSPGTPDENNNGDESGILDIDLNETTIQPMDVKDSESSYTQLSDHYGLSSLLSLRT